MSRILVVEDEDRIALFIERGLRADGYAVDRASDATSALASLRVARPDLVILDLGLPDRDGMDLLRQIRSERVRIPVVILTARSATSDRVQGLDLGADDYVTKPFDFDELAARIRARLRDPGYSEQEVMVYGDLRLDPRSRRASTPDRGEVELSAREFALLQHLMTQGSRVSTREQLVDRVWGAHDEPGSNVVEVYIGYLRRKVGAARIETIRGVGYRLAPPIPGRVR